MLSTKNLKIKQANSKFAPRYVGPFQVTRVRGAAVELGLPASMGGIHPVFHVGLLKPFFGTPPEHPPAIELEEESQYEVERLLKKKWLRNKVHYLV
jgi:hypothetical protein